MDKIAVCLHDDADGCSCRKPRRGMLLELAEQWNLDVRGSFVVGDFWKDICKPSRRLPDDPAWGERAATASRITRFPRCRRLWQPSNPSSRDPVNGRRMEFVRKFPSDTATLRFMGGFECGALGRVEFGGVR